MKYFFITCLGIAALFFFNDSTTTGQQPDPAAKATLESAISGQEAQRSDASPQKVTLRWKFKPGQVFQGKLAYGIRTMDDTAQKTSFIYEYTWDVQSLQDDGDAVIKVIVNRERFQHRSAKVHVDYDSNDDASFRPSETELSEIKPFVELVRQLHKREFLFVCSDKGEIWQAEDYETKPGMAINWPRLPEQPVGVGDAWTGAGDAKYELVKLEQIDGLTVAWIENKSETMRCRFLVDEGRYLDDVSWKIARIKTRQGGAYLQSYSQRCRLELVGGHDKFDQWQALQPSLGPGRAVNLIGRSFDQTDKITEHLWGEKGSLSLIQQGLFIEHVEEMEFPEPSQQLEPIDSLIWARYCERSGDFARQGQFLKDGAVATAAIPDKVDLRRNIFLLQFAELLAGIGEFEAARRACMEISPESMTGAVFTESGVVSLPKAALRNYGLLIVAREQAKVGLTEESSSTARSIADPPIRSAAHWIVAMHLADHGKLDSAAGNAVLAEELFAADATVFELESGGPVEVPVQAYRTLALGRVAIGQAKQGDESAMRKTIAMIKNPAEKNAVLVDLIVALDKEGMTGLVDKLTKELPELSRSTAIAYLAAMRLQTKNFEGVERMIETIGEPTWKAASHMNFCMALRYDSDRAVDLQRHLDLAKAAIQQISVPRNRASSMIDYALVLIATGRQEDAREQLMAAIELVNDESMKDAEKTEMQLRIAKVLAGVDSAVEFEDLMGKIETIEKGLKEFEKANFELSMVEIYLEKNEMKKSESIAEKIEDASIRCKALALVGKRYAQLLELERSRKVFEKAYESAMKVVDAAGLDTVHSKGGAIRYVAQQQGECDLEGLVYFTEDSTDPNLVAYGLIGGVEAYDPDAAAAAKKTGRIPETILKEVCESSIACQLLEGRLQPPDKTPRTKEKKQK